MPQTVANMSGILKDAWTGEQLAKQFYNQNPLLEWFKSITPTMIGLQAQVPIHKYRAGGQTSTGPAGGTLNPADNQKTDQALYTMVYLWKQIQLETGALNQSNGNAQSIIAAKDLEIQGAIDDMGKESSRQLVGNGDGFIAQCTTTTTSNVIALLPPTSGGLGYDAIVRGFLYPGMTIDIGTTADSDSQATSVLITDVFEDPVAPTITVNGAAISTTTSHFVSIANPNSTTAANPELNGLQNMVGSNGSLGGINPGTAGNSYWKPAAIDSTTTSFSLDLALNLQRAVFQKNGGFGSKVLTSPKQMQNFYSLLQNQVRFTGESGLGAGGVGGLIGLNWNGMGVNVWPDIPDKFWYYLTGEDFVRISGTYKEPTWTSELEGSQGLRWNQGTTSFSEGLFWAGQAGMKRRNRSAVATNLVA